MNDCPLCKMGVPRKEYKTMTDSGNVQVNGDINGEVKEVIKERTSYKPPIDLIRRKEGNRKGKRAVLTGKRKGRARLT